MHKSNEVSPAEQKNKILKATEEDYIREIIRMVSEIQSKERLIKIYTWVKAYYQYEMEERAAGNYFENKGDY